MTPAWSALAGALTDVGRARERNDDALLVAPDPRSERAGPLRGGDGDGPHGRASVQGVVSIVHVGDSRAYLWRRGTLRQLTADHTLGAALFGQGRIDRTEAAEGPVRSVLMRALGAQNGEVDVAGSATLPGDRLVLCSDGLYSMVDDDSIARVVGNPGSPQQACERLVRLANDAGGLDNVTVVVVAFEPLGFRA